MNMGKSIYRMMALAAVLPFIFSCEKPEPEDKGNGGQTGQEPGKTEVLTIELAAPKTGTEFDLLTDGSVDFEWEAVEGVEEYTVLLSKVRTMDEEETYEFSATGTKLSVPAEDIDDKLAKMGFYYREKAKVYWQVIHRDAGTEELRAKSKVVPFNIVRPEKVVDNTGRIADPLTIKVAIVYEDPLIPDTFPDNRKANGEQKRLHEYCTVGNRGAAWNNPVSQAVKFEADLEESSHGVVRYEVVETIWSDQFWTFDNKKYSANDPDKKYITLDTLINHVYATGAPEVPGIGAGMEFDYEAMIRHYDFGKKRDAGEIHEVWVYTHPGCGMYESRLVGKGAFWCNSGGINDASICQDLITVMFCNYERTTDLALHSYAHRVESIMKMVYNDRWSYNHTSLKKNLNNWELYSAHQIEFNKFEAGYSHVGCCHWPHNSTADYDYSNMRNVYTYADVWYQYPDLRDADNPKSARYINSSEWGSNQQGYMMWFFGHLPHFKGLNEADNDLHLNNWWHYIVDWNDANSYERRLQRELL